MMFGVVMASPAVDAQMLNAPWVGHAEARIDACRKVAVRVIVLDAAGRPAPGAKLRIVQQRHAFSFGVRLNPDDFRDGVLPPAGRDEQPVYRCFNAASLDLASNWPTTGPNPGQWDFMLVDDMVTWANRRGMTLRWGSLTSADPGRVPPWVAPLHGRPLLEAYEAHLHAVLGRFGRRIEQFDVHTDATDHDLASSRLGPAVVRRLYEQARAAAPQAVLGLRFEDGLLGERLAATIRAINDAREDLVPFDAVVIEQRLGGMIVQTPLQKALESLGNVGVPVIVTNLEVGGPTPGAAAINLETVLRTLFAEASVRGIWFAGVASDEVGDPAAALVDAAGQPTPAGTVLDSLIRRLWWTDSAHDADELGNVRTRVFAGVHRLEATLPGGVLADASVYLAPGAHEQVVFVRPLQLTGER